MGKIKSVKKCRKLQKNEKKCKKMVKKCKKLQENVKKCEKMRFFAPVRHQD